MEAGVLSNSLHKSNGASVLDLPQEVVYISSGGDSERAVEWLWESGCAVVCPMSCSAYSRDNEAGYRSGCLEIVTRCDSIYMLRGWQWDEAAVEERRVAEEMGMNIYYEE